MAQKLIKGGAAFTVAFVFTVVAPKLAIVAGLVAVLLLL